MWSLLETVPLLDASIHASGCRTSRGRSGQAPTDEVIIARPSSINTSRGLSAANSVSKYQICFTHIHTYKELTYSVKAVLIHKLAFYTLYNYTGFKLVQKTKEYPTRTIYSIY